MTVSNARSKYEAYWKSIAFYPVWKKLTNLPMMATRGLLDDFMEHKSTWDDKLVGWELASFATYRHNVNKSFDIDEISSLDPQYALGATAKPL